MSAADKIEKKIDCGSVNGFALHLPWRLRRSQVRRWNVGRPRVGLLVVRLGHDRTLLIGWIASLGPKSVGIGKTFGALTFGLRRCRGRCGGSLMNLGAGGEVERFTVVAGFVGPVALDLVFGARPFEAGFGDFNAGTTPARDRTAS